jgi:hypothetical protein
MGWIRREGRVREKNRRTGGEMMRREGREGREGGPQSEKSSRAREGRGVSSCQR